MLLYASIIFLVALAGGCLPLLMRWTDRLLHSMLALSTGIFLGAVFLHLLPSLSHLENQANGAGASGHLHGENLSLWFFVLLGVLGVYLTEALVLRTHDHDDVHRHRAVGYAALVGLAVHSLTNGIGLATAIGKEDLALAIFVSIIAHKGFEAFSLTSVFQLAEFPRRRIVLLMVLFSLVTPLGVLLGGALEHHLGDYGKAVLTALAAGTFLFVCLCELLPEVFHHRVDSVAKIALLAVGIATMVLLHWIGHV